ncbi:MAG: hypothetical protein ABJG68_04245 [Crocinitomicaceae bacterium]
MRRNQQTILYPLLTVLIIACSGQAEERSSDQLESLPEANEERNQDRDRMVDYKETLAIIDTQAMNQVTAYLASSAELSVWQKYDQTEDEYANWCDKLWGRCCTEADMRFTERLSYQITTSHDYKAYPFENALDPYYNTAYVFEAKDSIELKVCLDKNENYVLGFNKAPYEKLSSKDRIHDRFQISIINGYTKTEKTFYENARIKKVELWHNGKHKCNAVILDSPEIQIIKGTFAFHKLDEVRIVPIEYYKGSKYDDVCISAIQLSLGYGANPELDVKYGN